MFENDHEVSFLFRFIGVEFSDPDFELLYYIGICNGTFRLYFELSWIDIF